MWFLLARAGGSAVEKDEAGMVKESYTADRKNVCLHLVALGTI